MSCKTTCFNLDSLVRSAVILAVGLPLTVGFAMNMNTDRTPAEMKAVSATKASLVDGCVDYLVSKSDSKLERQGQDAIDEVLGADGADYQSLCNWVFG